MTNTEDVTGRKLHLLTAVSFVQKKRNHAYWLCKCDCGGEKIVRWSHVKSGNVKSCGCLQRQVLANSDPNIGTAAKGTGHWNAKFWGVWTPDRNFICGPNMYEIVRRHEHLFDAKDVVWKKHPCGSESCRATSGLINLFRIVTETKNGRVYKYVPIQWKGWRAATKVEMVKNVVAKGGAELRFRPELNNAAR